MVEINRNLRLGDLLLQDGVITQRQLLSALEEQHNSSLRLGEILVKKGWLTEKQLAEALGRQLKLPLVSLARFRPMPEAVRMVPRSTANRLRLIPLSITDKDHLFVAIADPLNVLAVDELRIMTGMEVDLGIANASEIERELERVYSMQGSLEDAIVEVVGTDLDDVEVDLSSLGEEADVDDAPVVKLVNKIIEEAVKEKASDVHIEPFEKSSTVRYRVDGMLYNSLDFPKNLHPAVSSRIKIMANMDISEKRKPQDGRILIKVLGRRIDLRVSSLPSIFGEKVVMRILDQANAMVGLEKLGFGPHEREVIQELITLSHGILLVTGPTGSGKSTTLYSVLEKINKPEVNIITVEDPVEYTIHGINQVQVNERAGLTFSEALRSILRQDPDKVMVGEIRDTETAQLAIRAALTGHLVLSTLHTNDATSAPVRLIDMGIPPFLIASSIGGVLAQRLVRKLCPYCKEEYEIAPNVCRSMGIPEGSHAWKPVGCNECRGMGYRGRSGIFEIFQVTEEIRRLIVEEAPSTAIRESAVSSGMASLRQSGLARVLDGTTSMEEVLSVTMS